MELRHRVTQLSQQEVLLGDTQCSDP
jgi:hypothetical protein